MSKVRKVIEKICTQEQKIFSSEGMEEIMNNLLKCTEVEVSFNSTSGIRQLESKIKMILRVGKDKIYIYHETGPHPFDTAIYFKSANSVIMEWTSWSYDGGRVSVPVMRYNRTLLDLSDETLEKLVEIGLLPRQGH